MTNLLGTGHLILSGGQENLGVDDFSPTKGVGNFSQTLSRGDLDVVCKRYCVILFV